MEGSTGGQNAHILVIEDNPGDVYLLRLALTRAGVKCDLTIVPDGGEALALVRQEGKYAGVLAPDLIILDLNLPKSDGLEVLAAMRSSRAFAAAPVAILSSSSSARERAELQKYQVKRQIAKPPDLDEFMRIGEIVKEILAEESCQL